MIDFKGKEKKEESISRGGVWVSLNSRYVPEIGKISDGIRVTNLTLDHKSYKSHNVMIYPPTDLLSYLFIHRPLKDVGLFTI